MALGLFIFFIIVCIIGVPIGFAMGAVTIASFAALGGDMMIIPQKLFSAVDNFTFLCIILYILAAEIMSNGGITESIVHFCDCLVGHVRGGLAYVNVLGSMLFAGISGSASADASGLGVIEIDIMTKAGYRREYASAVTAASAIIGPIIPPSSVMIIYAACAGGISVGKMFLGGLLPGILLGLSEMGICYYMAKKYNHPKRENRSSIKEIMQATYETLPSLILPLIILGGIVSGIFTATESGAIAVMYAIIVAFAKKTLTLKSFYECCVRSAKTTASVMFIIAVASAMGWAITTLQITQKLVAFFMSYVSSPGMFLLIVNILLLAVGCLLDTSPALLLMVPILLPVAMEFGIDPVHFGVVVCINLIVGLITPPVGMTLFVTSNVAKIKLTDLYKEILPFVAAAIIVLFIITYVPFLTTALPNWLM